MIYAKDAKECFACDLFWKFYDIMSLSHFEFIFECGKGVYSNFIDLYAAVQLSLYHLLKKGHTHLCDFPGLTFSTWNDLDVCTPHW